MIDQAHIAKIAEDTEGAYFAFSFILTTMFGSGAVYILAMMIRMRRTRIRRMTPLQRQEHDEVMQDLKTY